MGWGEDHVPPGTNENTPISPPSERPPGGHPPRPRYDVQRPNLTMHNCCRYGPVSVHVVGDCYGPEGVAERERLASQPTHGDPTVPTTCLAHGAPVT